MKYFFYDIKNRLDFFLRNLIVCSRQNYIEYSENKENIFENEKQELIFNNLNNIYNLELLQNTTIQNYLENLYFINVFNQYFSKTNYETMNILDVGSKNWYYAKSEYIFFKKYSKNINLTGIELDSNRMCSNFYTRHEIAKYHIKNLDNTQYISGNFLDINGKYDRIVWILPFITEHPHVKWGLPLKYFKPEEMLNHALDLLNENGEILIINQGKDEYNFQQKLNESFNLKIEYFGEIEDIFEVFKHKRFCCKIKY